MSDMKLTIKKIGLAATDDDGESEVIPLIPDENDEVMKNGAPLPDVMPILALRNAILFPGTVLPVNVGRKKSLALVKAMEESRGYFVATPQRNSEVDDPTVEDLYKMGTLARVVKILEMPDNSTTVILQGRIRMFIWDQVDSEPYITANVSRRDDTPVAEEEKEEFKAIVSSIKDMAVKVIKESNSVPPETAFAVKNIEGGAFLIHFIASNLDIKIAEKAKLLSVESVYQRGLYLMKLLQQEIQFLELKNDIQSKVKKGIDQQQREYMLQQQIRTIQDELGDNPIEQQINEFREKAKSKKWPDEVAEVFEKEIDKLERINPNVGEYSIQVNYLEVMLDLPWDETSEDNFDIQKAENQLNADHYGLDKVKERILEHLAVLQRKNDLKSPILCFYGPPGVGKTSLGKSIADALGRKYVRMSLGGLHDEAEIRGHRRTYIGAMPGRILQNIKKAGTSNPVFVLDEIDKISTDFHGDPASALLEVLDPEQNMAFHDNFLDIDYDLSKVMFIATANNISHIAAPLLDRMELINVSGYITEEKIEIAARHLLPKQLAAHGLDKKSDDDNKPVFGLNKKIISYIVENYTRESGVRELDKVLARLCRKVSLDLARNVEIDSQLTKTTVRNYLGTERYTHDIWQSHMMPGVVTGLAWTAVGGEILFVEASISKGKGKMTITGNLGDVMKESAVLALEFVRSNAASWKLESVDFDELNVHIHVPEGAIPKDGPSAGITMVTAIVSALTQRKVQKRIAMTGEITLRGKVLPVGGIKEKILAAKRAGITDIILSVENRKDIDEIKDIYLKGLTFHYVKAIAEVIEIALEPQQ